MRIAIVLTARRAHSPIAEELRCLVPALAEQAEVELFAPDALRDTQTLGGAGALDCAERPLRELVPRRYQQILYALGNEAAHGFMLPMVRTLGGAVALDSWSLAAPAHAAYAELEHSGLRGALRAWREGGGSDLAAWRASRRAGERGGAGARPLALNRSVVRFADAFLVPDEALRALILESRNAPTPIGIVPLDIGARPAAERAAIAERWLAACERFPRPRASRRALVALAWQRARDEVRSKPARNAPPGSSD